VPAVYMLLGADRSSAAKLTAATAPQPAE
jgi:hypothetical protein